LNIGLDTLPTIDDPCYPYFLKIRVLTGSALVGFFMQILNKSFKYLIFIIVP